MQRKVQLDSDLKKAAGLVNYEIDMLVFSAEHLGGSHSSPKAEPEDMEKNMAMEAFLLHFRNLRAFLCPKMQSLWDDDVIATDFLKESSERNVVSAILPGEKDRIDKMLAHI